MTTEWFTITRAVHIGACLLFFGLLAFDIFVLRGGWSRSRLLHPMLLAVILVSGVGWFVVVAITMSSASLDMETAKTVWFRTHFGGVWRWRLALWAAALVVTLARSAIARGVAGRSVRWIEFLCATALLASLAWAGHGQEDSRWHLAADVLHLLVAGFWPAGLLPLVMMLRRAGRTPEREDWDVIAENVRRFSAVGLVSVALLTATGWVNAWFLAGSFANLIGQPYGRWLLAKIILFAITIGIAAVNLLRLKPQLSLENGASGGWERAAAQLRFNVYAEVFLAMLIVLVVGILGILPPSGR